MGRRVVATGHTVDGGGVLSPAGDSDLGGGLRDGFRDRNPDLQDAVLVGGGHVVGGCARRQLDGPVERSVLELRAVAVLVLVLGLGLALCLDAQFAVRDGDVHILVRIDVGHLRTDHHGLVLLELLDAQPGLVHVALEPMLDQFLKVWPLTAYQCHGELLSSPG